MSAAMKKDLKASEKAVREEAIRKFGEANKNSKKVRDYVYKYRRAHYFRNRPSKANRPPYSGFSTLVFLSTGVVRNLLEPCYWMFDNAVSRAREIGEKEGSETISNIPANIQAEVIQRLSERKWEWARDNIAQDIEDCSTEDGERAFNLLNALAKLFRDRLQHHQS